MRLLHLERRCWSGLIAERVNTGRETKGGGSDYILERVVGENMPTDMSHERMRWTQMGDRQLITRLGRITRADKLRNYIVLARERVNQRLLILAYARARDLGYNHLVPHVEQRSVETMVLAELAQPAVTPLPMPAPIDIPRKPGRSHTRVIRFKKKD